MARIVNYLPESFHLPDFCIQNAVKKGKKIPQTLVTSGLRGSVVYSYSTAAGELFLRKQYKMIREIRNCNDCAVRHIALFIFLQSLAHSVIGLGRKFG